MKSTLEEQIRRIGGPSVSEARKQELKNRIFSSISAVKQVREVALGTEVNLHYKVVVLERLRELMSRSRGFGFFSGAFLRRQFAAGLLVMVMVMGGFSFVNIETNVVFAAEFTKLSEVDGDVKVERDGSQIAAYEGMRLYENDRVYTADNALAVVEFFDDSVSRLASSSILKIDKLNSLDADLSSYVQVEVMMGQMWSKVVSLVADNSAFVVKANDVVTKVRKGTFNLKVNGNLVEIGVVGNEVSVSGEKFKEQLKVVTGQKVVKIKSYDYAPKVVDLSGVDKESEWFQANLSDDRDYVKQLENHLIVSKMKSVGVDNTEDISLDNSVGESTLKFITFDSEGKHKLELDLAEKRFVVAQLKLLQSDLTEAERADAIGAIEEFYNVVQSFYVYVSEVVLNDKDDADELWKYAHDKVVKQKKLLSATLPDAPYYFAKDVIAKIETIGIDGVELAKVKQDQAQDKLATVQEVVNNGNLGLATKVLEEYQNDISEVVTILDKDDAGTVDDKAQIIQEVKDNSVVLKAIDDISADFVAVKELEVDQNLIEDKGEVKEFGEVAEVSENEDEEEKDQEEQKILDTQLNFNFQIQQNLDFSNLITDGPFGVQLQGDKPLDPLL